MAWSKLGGLSRLAQAVLVSGALLVAWLFLAPLAAWLDGSAGLGAAGVGAAVCWLGAIVALLFTALLRGAGSFLPRLLMGMMARTMLPLLLGTLLHVRVGWLAAAGMIYYLLVFYMVSLTIETMLLLAENPSAFGSKGAG